MALDKKSFILYTDINETVKKLTDDEAGKLFKTICSYVCDENPEITDRLTELLFEPIKQSLKRDLIKYQVKSGKNSEAGRIGNLKRWNEDLYEKLELGKMTLEEAELIAINRKCDKSIAKIADSVSVSDIKERVPDFPKKENAPTSEKTIESNQLLINQTEPESFNPLHFFIAKSYHNFFLKSKGKIRTLTKVETKSYVKTIRLMLENDGVTVEQMVAVKMFLDDSISEGSRLDSFWANTIYSMATFREKKNDVYRWDMIKKEADKWGKIEGNVARVSKAHAQLMEKVNSYAGI